MADAPKTGKHVVTNTSDGPRMLNAMPPIVLKAGESTDGSVEMTEAEQDGAEKSGWFKFGAAAAKAAKADDKN